MHTKIYISFFFIVFLLFNSIPALAEQDSKSDTTSLSQKENRVCSLIRERVREESNIKKIVKTSIQMGYNSCFVIKCAFENGGVLEQIITGALEGGATSDVIAKCALDAGADDIELSNIFARTDLPNLCYLSPRDELIPMPTGYPGGKDDRRISPSSF